MHIRRTFLAGTVVLAILAVVATGWTQRRGPGPGPGGFRGGYENSSNPPLPKSEAEKRVLATQEKMVAAGDLFSNVPMNDGRMLRILTEAVGAKNVVELGTSTGYSGLWFCTALLTTGGKLTTFEFDANRAATARRYFQQAGVDGIVTIIEGDAHQNVTKLKGPIDVVFIDADKEGYLDYLNKLLPLVRPGGMILAHNVNTAPDYVRAVTTNPELETSFYSQGNGLGITLKKR